MRCVCFPACLAMLLSLTMPIGSRPSPAPGQENGLSPSFTWGEGAPATGRSGLSGVYERAAVTSEMSVAAHRFISRAKRTYWCFFPDGRCYYSMPTEGLDNFNYDYVRPMNELWGCTYQLKGDEGTIAWGTGGTTLAFRRSGRSLLMGRNADAYEPLDPCNGLKLEGLYKRDDWQDEISVKAGITFSRDGTFVDEGFLAGAISTWWRAGGGLVEAQFAPGRGTYRVANNSLVLLYSDGRKIRANFHLAEQATRDNVTAFIISTRRFIKVK